MIELELRCIRMGAVWADRDFKAGAGRTVSCGDGSDFLFADHRDAGRLNRPIAGMVSIPIGQSGLPPPTGGHPDPKSEEVAIPL